MKQLDIKSFIIFILILIVILKVRTYLESSEMNQERRNIVAETASTTAVQEIRVVVSSQDSEGLTVANFDQPFLKYFESTTVDGVKRKTEDYYSTFAKSASIIEFHSEANYVESGPTKLAVVRLSSTDGARQVFIAGLVGKEFKRVLCVRNSTETIPITYGICAEKIKDVFGVSLGV